MSRIGIGTALTLFLLSFFHVYWACGGRLGADLSVPEINGKKAFVPSRRATLTVALLLALACSCVLFRTSQVEISFVRVSTWVLVVVFAARAVGDFRLIGFFKRIKGTQFSRYDTRVFSPLCLALAIGCALVSLDQ